MNHSEILNAEQVTRVIHELSLPGLIRLVSEIDDNGAIEHGMLGRTFPDLTRQQIRNALAAGRELQLLREGTRAMPFLRLTRRGAGLADVYDQLARWARVRDYPSRTSTFVSRVQGTLSLLAQRCNGNALLLIRHAAHCVAPGTSLVSDTADEGLQQSWAALSRWVQAAPSTVSAPTPAQSAAGGADTPKWAA
ncbi:hypothetical protein [Streptomyces sp. AK02-01A]|uniref:hypothetical protein n=1 Tax=Streptomyces sp. AK02-01A TaxID=3028648 RepID=UPI0029A8AFA9|nr:hypothetical protein [Streptomyces sp. AK02-01A]MDX3854906.1 hypothetical protein [Streptomyces sp. AK02-01A]